MRVGVVGVGRIGAVHAARVAADPRVDRLVVVDTDPVRTEAVVRAVGSTAYVGTGVGPLLAEGVDAVVVATPTDAHAMTVLACCAAGTPVFCEKPVSGDLAETRRVADRVRASGVLVQVGFQRRFDPGYRAVRAALRSGELGELRRVHVVTADPSPPSADYVARSGGIHRDCQVHDFDALRWVTGREVAEVYVMGSARSGEPFTGAGDVDESAGVLTLDDGTLATLQASRFNGAGYDVRLELAGTRGTAVAGLDARAPLRSTEATGPELSGPPWPGFLPRFADAYDAELTAFLDAVVAGGPSPCSVDDSLRAQLVAEAAELSRRERRPVSVGEVGGCDRLLKRARNDEWSGYAHPNPYAASRPGTQLGSRDGSDRLDHVRGGLGRLVGEP